MADNMTPEQRRITMSRIRSRDTKVELAIRKELHRRGHRFRVNAAWLAGKPDVVFTKIRLAIFIDGDFWHGWQFKRWAYKLPPYWYQKIRGNIARDRQRRALLRREGWAVMSVWEHDVKKNFERCIRRIEAKIDQLRES
ncbi:DNA mismatch endonuclease (patch repair protein) [Paraburkholderia graminis]|uniref:very short patch repair endonuclease n=1 Tax=Paraburkholderia graminis TaxID=60548 RepID=UPI00285CAC01|nr:very short patch repair endonuclease [Paraburkholderia graminis]MDR6469236.1 DNA mismatch endonuclease (patch repair protein) [Paraburkholderia graminis]